MAETITARDDKKTRGGVIYKITCAITGKCYIGQTRQPPARRWSQHKQAAKKGGKMILYDAIRKHGVENFTFEIYCTCETLEELNKKEIEVIRDENSLAPNGYNAGLGGDNYEKTEITRKKLSLANSGRVITPEWRENMRKGHANRPTITEEARQKRSVALKGRKVSEETKEKLRNANLGKKQSPETLAKKRASRIGVPWSAKKRESMVGRKASDETKQKQSAALKGRIITEEAKQKLIEAKRARRKLSNEQVAEIRSNPDGLLQKDLAEKYGVSKQLITNILLHRTAY
jgi:group I intron endonuclease